MTTTLDDAAITRSDRPRDGVTRVRSWELVVLVLAMLTVAVIGAVAINRGAPLLWDEAVYSLRARELVGENVRGTYWIDVRAPGLPSLLAPVSLLVGRTDEALRAVCLLFAVAGIPLTWIIARALIGPTVAAVAAWLLAISPGWNDSSWQVMPDIPGTVLALATMAVILLAARGDRLSWWALCAAPLAGAATLVRYGAPLLIGPTVVAALLLRWRVVMASRVRAAATLALSALAAGVVWFVPAVTNSRVAPVVLYSTRQDNKAVPALESAADFATSLLTLVGPVVGVLAVVGAALAVVAARRTPALRGPVIACALIALSVLVLMLFGIAEYQVRYLAPALPFLAILAATGLVFAAGAVRPRTALAVAVGLAVLGGAVAFAATWRTVGELHQSTRSLRAAYTYVADETDGPCVLLDWHRTSEWYTGCAGMRPNNLSGGFRRMRREGVSDDEPMYILTRRRVGRQLSSSVEAVLGDVARRTVRFGPDITVFDVGTFGGFHEELRRRGLLARS